jgi:two-component system chemotaxis response regulator CheY
MWILCVEDEPEVRDALLRDVEHFETVARIESAENVDDARAVVRERAEAGDQLALVLCDHLLPGIKGVDFLVELNASPIFAPARKVLVTGQAGLDDTVKAVNDARLDHYIAKPWKVEQLHKVVRQQLTDYAIQYVADLLPLVATLDGPRLLKAIKERKVSE